jgi:hypothetical protein
MLTTDGDSFSTSSENPSGAGFASAAETHNKPAAMTPTILINTKAPSKTRRPKRQRRRPLDQRRAW